MEIDALLSKVPSDDKFYITLAIAAGVPWVLALILTLLFFPNALFFLFTGGTLCYYSLTAGLQKNGELEVSVGGWFGTLTTWIIPPGYSWWFPSPIGQALKRTAIGKREFDRRFSKGREFKKIETSDNNQVSLSCYGLYEISDPAIWVLVHNPAAALDATVEQYARWFVNEWPVDEIANQKENVSKYLMGETVLVHKKDPDTGEPIGNEKPLESDIQEVLANELGVRFLSMKVDNINPPESFVKAREAEALEDSEARKEEKNMDALIKQTERLIELGVDPDHAIDVNLITRGDSKSIYVGGNAGDFTKASAITNSK